MLGSNKYTVNVLAASRLKFEILDCLVLITYTLCYMHEWLLSSASSNKSVVHVSV